MKSNPNTAPLSNLKNWLTLKNSTIEYKDCSFDFEEKNELKLFH